MATDHDATDDRDATDRDATDRDVYDPTDAPQDPFFARLDDLAGVPADRSMPDPETTEPVPLSEGLAERALDDLQRRRTRTDAPTVVAMPRRWLRPAAMWPLAFLVLAAATCWAWSGRKSRETLPYEDAFGVVFDTANYGREARNSAMGRIVGDIHHGITSLRKLEKEPALARMAKAALADLRRFANGGVERAAQAPEGSMRRSRLTLRDPSTSFEKKESAAFDFVRSARAGFALVYKAKDEPGFLGKQASLALRGLQRRLEKK